MGDLISRQAALKKFTYSYKGERIPDYDCDNFPTQISFVDARKVIRELPPVEPEKCGDCISRQAVLDAMKKRDEELSSICPKDIRELSPVTPQPKIGRWINIEDRTDWYDSTYKCSCCGREIITPYDLENNLYSDYPYCHCGAKMVEPQESEDKYV